MILSLLFKTAFKQSWVQLVHPPSSSSRPARPRAHVRAHACARACAPAHAPARAHARACACAHARACVLLFSGVRCCRDDSRDL